MQPGVFRPRRADYSGSGPFPYNAAAVRHHAPRNPGDAAPEAAAGIRRLAAAALVLAALLWPAPARALPPETDVWIRADTSHFTLISNASERHTREVGRRLELFREVLARLNPRMTLHSPLPTTIYVFKHEGSFRPYKKKIWENVPEIAGYFVSHRDGNYVAVNATMDGDPFGAVYHEYVHYVMYNNFPLLPLWFNEGLAECYSTFREKDGRVDIGRPVDNSVAWLKHNPWMPLHELLTVDAQSPEYNERSRQGRFYAQSWALAHYLIWGEPRWIDALPDRIKSLNEGRSLAAITRTPSYDDLQAAIREYIRRGKILYSVYELADLTIDERTEVRPLGRAEAIYRLGDFLAHTDPDRAPEAEAHFREAIRLDPKHARAWAGLGLLLDMSDHHEHAAQFYERSLQLDPDDALSNFLYATSLMDRYFPAGLSKGEIPPGGAEAFAHARSLFRTSIHLQADLAEAYAGLGATYTFESGPLKEGIEALETAHRMLPSRMDVVFNLAGLLARSGQPERARHLVEEVLARGADPVMLQAARESLLDGDIIEAQKLVEQKRYDEALQLLDRVLATTRDPAMKTRLGKQIADLRRGLDRNRLVDRYNEAVRLANAGQYTKARDILRVVAREAGDDEEMRAMATKLLADIERVSGSSRPAD